MNQTKTIRQYCGVFITYLNLNSELISNRAKIRVGEGKLTMMVFLKVPSVWKSIINVILMILLL